jgi:hypothetical protein
VCEIFEAPGAVGQPCGVGRGVGGVLEGSHSKCGKKEGHMSRVSHVGDQGWGWGVASEMCNMGV